MNGWILDRSASSRAHDPDVAAELDQLSGSLFMCPMGELEYLYSARSAADYDQLKTRIRGDLQLAVPPPDILGLALILQRDLAHHHGMWHRTAIGDLLIAETALHNDLGVVHIDSDYERIAEVRPLTVRRLSTRKGAG